MKKRVFLAAGIAVLSTAVLAACSSGNGNKEATKPVTYAYVFSSDPATLDYTVSGQNSTKQITGNVIDGLLENDQYGNLVPSVAEDWTVSKKSSIEMTKNQNYWDKRNVFIDDIKLSFFDCQCADSLGRGFDEVHYPAAPLFKNYANYERLK